MPASLHWIPLDVEFPTSGKAIALGVALGNPSAWCHVVRLWCWCARNAPDGAVSGPAAVAVMEHAAGWTGPAGAFVEACALRHIRLLDETTDGYAVHDWADHCGAHVEKRRRDSSRMKDYRKRVRERYANGTRTDRERYREEEEGEGEEQRSRSSNCNSSPSFSSLKGGTGGEEENLVTLSPAEWKAKKERQLAAATRSDS